MRMAYSQLLDISQLFLNFSGEITMNKPVLDAQTLQNLAEGDRAVISGFQGTIQVGYGGPMMQCQQNGRTCSSSKGAVEQTCGTLRNCGPSQCYLWIFMDLDGSSVFYDILSPGSSKVAKGCCVSSAPGHRICG